MTISFLKKDSESLLNKNVFFLFSRKNCNFTNQHHPSICNVKAYQQKASKVHNHFFIHTLKKMIVRKFTKYTPLKNYMPSNKMYDQCYKSTIKSSSQNQNSNVPHFLFFIAKKNLLCHNNNITSYLLRNDFLGSF